MSMGEFRVVNPVSSMGSGGTPAPVSAMSNVPSSASSLRTRSVVVRAPASRGVKAIVKVVAPATGTSAIMPTVVTLKSSALPPATLTPVMCSGALPEFRIVKAVAAPVVAMDCGANATVELRNATE